MKLFKQNKNERKSGIDALIGRSAIVTEAIDPENNKGRIAVDGDNWKAVSEDNSYINKDSHVIITKIDSIQLFMKKDDSYDSNLYQMIYDKSHKSRNTIMRILELTENRQDLDSLMGSLIHMTMNRIFVAQQRKHEVVVYGFMERFYRSEVAKNKYVKNK